MLNDNFIKKEYKVCQGCSTVFLEDAKSYEEDMCIICKTPLTTTNKHIIIGDGNNVPLAQIKKIEQELYNLYIKDNEENLKKYEMKLKIEKEESERNQLLFSDIQEEDDEEIRCPNCGSSQITSTKRGFSLGKAAAGGLLLGGVGLLGGLVGSNKIMLTCLKCGHQFKPNQD